MVSFSNIFKHIDSSSTFEPLSFLSADLRQIQKIFRDLSLSEDDLNPRVLASIKKLEESPEALTLEDFESYLWPLGKKLLEIPDLVKTNDKAPSSGKGFLGKAEILWLITHFSENLDLFSMEEVISFKEVEFLSSSLADREPPAGVWIQLPHRQHKKWRVDWSRCESGCFVFALRSPNDPQKIILVCRGTAFRKNSTGGFESAVNDLLPQMGSWGVTSLWPNLYDWLKQEDIKEMEVMGKSLGGCNAQMLATATLHSTDIKLTKINTLQSAGVDKQVHDIFENAIDKQYSGLDLTITRWNVHLPDQPVDVVPFIGGYHLAQTPSSTRPCGLKVRNIYIGQKDSHRFLSDWSFQLPIQLLKGLATTHSLQIRLLDSFPPLYIEELTSENPTGSLLPKAEALRQTIAKVITFPFPLVCDVLNRRFETIFEITNNSKFTDDKSHT